MTEALGEPRIGGLPEIRAAVTLNAVEEGVDDEIVVPATLRVSSDTGVLIVVESVEDAEVRRCHPIPPSTIMRISPRNIETAIP